MKKNWKSLLSLAMTLALVAGSSNAFEAHAASANVYTNNFEKSVGDFKGFEGAKVKLSSKVDLSASKDAVVSSLAAEVTSGTANIVKQTTWDGTANNLDLSKFFSATSKDELSKATSIKIVMSVDTAENYTADKTATAQVFFMGNGTWSWVTGDPVSVKAGEDFTVSIPASKLTWGATDTAIGQCGVQLFNFKEGDVKYVVKSITLEGLKAAEPTPAVEEPAEEDDSALSVGKAKAGKNYLFVTDRWEATSGAKVDLSKKMKAGSKYKVTAYVKSVGADSDSFQLLFSDSAKAKGKVIAKVKSKTGKWVKIEGTLTVPKTAKNVIVKFNTKETSIDFGIDSVTVKKVK